MDDSTIAEMREESDLVWIVGMATPLRPSGKTLKGECPMCHDESGRFYVDPDKKLFYCFGCGVGGDVFKFISLTEKISFQQAVEYVAALLPGAKTN